MASQLSKKAALPLAKILATCRNNVSSPGLQLDPSPVCLYLLVYGCARDCQWPLKTVNIPSGHIRPKYIATEAFPNGCSTNHKKMHIAYPTDSVTVTSLSMWMHRFISDDDFIDAGFCMLNHTPLLSDILNLLPGYWQHSFRLPHAYYQWSKNPRLYIVVLYIDIRGPELYCSKYLREHVCFFIPHPRGLIQLFLLKFWVKQLSGRMVYTTALKHLEQLWDWPYVRSEEKSSLFP